MQARYYDPVIGRFYSNDPVGSIEHLGGPGGTHGFKRYAYANINPYKETNKTGITGRYHNQLKNSHRNMPVSLSTL